MQFTKLFGHKSKFEKFTKMGHDSSVLLLALVEDILDLSKIEAGTFKITEGAFNLADLINEVNDLFQYQCEQKHIEVDNYIDEVFLNTKIISDKQRIRQILLNLLSNSLKFTFEGTIGIKAKLIDYSGDPMVQICVEDTGIGIKDEQKNRLFKLFSTMSEYQMNPNGTGLGLTICRKYLDKLGGSIWAESEYGKGTLMTFNFPFKTEKGIEKKSKFFLNKRKSSFNSFELEPEF